MRNEKVTSDVERQRDHVTHPIARGETIKEVEVEAPGDIDIQVSYAYSHKICMPEHCMQSGHM